MRNYSTILTILLSGLIITSHAQNSIVIPITPAFEKNVGQFDDGIFYQINTLNGNIKFCQNKVVFTYVKLAKAATENQAIASQLGKETCAKGHTWEMVFDSNYNACNTP